MAGAAMSDDAILVERADGYATIVLNRPEKLNTLSIRMRQQIAAAIAALEADAAERLRPEAEALARQMLACVPETLVAYKRLLDAEAEVALGEALRLEREASLANNVPVTRAEIDARLVPLRGRQR